MGVWRNFGMVSSSVKDVFFFLTSATSSENDASKCFQAPFALLNRTGEGRQPQDRDWVAEIWCFSTSPGWPGCGRSFVVLLESYVDLLKAKRERNNQELLGAPSTDWHHFHQHHWRICEKLSCSIKHWRKLIFQHFEKNTIFHFSIVIVIVFPKYIQC